MTARQVRFVAAVLTAGSMEEAAATAGVPERTAWRFLRHPVVRAELRARQDAALSAAAAGLAQDVAEARSVLRGIMSDATTAPGVRVAAAGKILDCAVRLCELASIVERVGAIEIAISERG